MAAPESGEREGVGGSNEQKTVPANYGLRNLLALETAALVRNETEAAAGASWKRKVLLTVQCAVLVGFDLQ